MPCGSGPQRSGKGTKNRDTLTAEQIAKRQRLRQLGPIEIRDGLAKKKRGRPKMTFPNPITRLHEHEEITMTLQTAVDEPAFGALAPGPLQPNLLAAQKPKGPPLKIIFQNAPGSKLLLHGSEPIEIQGPKSGRPRQKRFVPYGKRPVASTRPESSVGDVSYEATDDQAYSVRDDSTLSQCSGDFDLAAPSPVESYPATPSPAPCLAAAPGFVQDQFTNVYGCVEYSGVLEAASGLVDLNNNPTPPPAAPTLPMNYSSVDATRNQNFAFDWPMTGCILNGIPVSPEFVGYPWTK